MRIIGAKTASKKALSSSSAMMCLPKFRQAWIEAPSTKYNIEKIRKKTSTRAKKKDNENYRQ